MDNKVIDNRVFLITGATGLIGKTIIKRLQSINQTISIIAIVRDRNKAIQMIGAETDKLRYLVSDICSLEPENMNIDYIIHAAGQTSSNAFINEPVETIMTTFLGTKNMLEFAKVNPIKGFVYLSTMEVYGTPSTDEKINELYNTNLDTMKVRSCYPESKRLCENLCSCYFSQHAIPAKVVRLTQTFGPGVRYNDNRVFAEFARCAIEGKDIILHTKGETKRNYLYTVDAANAILDVLINGVPGEAYNAANEETYCSIYEMANLVAEKCANGKISVVIEETDTSELGYAPVLHMNLDTSKIRQLGWKPTCGLQEMFDRMINDMSKNMIH